MVNIPGTKLIAVKAKLKNDIQQAYHHLPDEMSIIIDKAFDDLEKQVQR